MSLQVTLEYAGNTGKELEALGVTWRDITRLHAHLAGAAESYVKTKGPGIAELAKNHRVSTRLGAIPTGHLERAFAAIESSSNSGGASLFIPSASRLRAAFGEYDVVPVNSKYLTIPANAAAYGHRAREFTDLVCVAVGPLKQLVLARPIANHGLEIMYVLSAGETIPEDRSLFPFDELEEAMVLQAEYFYNQEIARTLAQ